MFQINITPTGKTKLTGKGTVKQLREFVQMLNGFNNVSIFPKNGSK